MLSRGGGEGGLVNPETQVHGLVRPSSACKPEALDASSLDDLTVGVAHVPPSRNLEA